MNSNALLKILGQALKAASLFSVLVGAGNFVMTVNSVPLLTSLGSLGWGLFFAATFWGQALLVNAMITKNP